MRACVCVCVGGWVDVDVGARALACACARVDLLIQHEPLHNIVICGFSGPHHIFQYYLENYIHFAQFHVAKHFIRIQNHEEDWFLPKNS